MKSQWEGQESLPVDDRAFDAPRSWAFSSRGAWQPDSSEKILLDASLESALILFRYYWNIWPRMATSVCQTFIYEA